jgi:outer membrane protein assembly factor BamB
MIAGHCVRAVSLLLVALAVLFGATEAATAQPSLLVTSQLDHTVKEYDGTTGAFIRNAATQVGDPLDAIIGADGNLLVTDGQQNAIKRFDRATGTFLGIFANAVSPGGLTISGSKVYVCQGNPPQIVRSFDAVTGADVGSFVPTVGGGNPALRDVKVANGRLYVAYWNLGTIEMFDITTRQSLGLLFPPGTGGLATPSSMAFGPDGNLYVSYSFFVNRYHPTTGEFLGQFVDTGDRTGQRYAIGRSSDDHGNRGHAG